MIPLFYPRWQRRPSEELRPSLHWKGLLFIACEIWLWRAVPTGAARALRALVIAQAVRINGKMTLLYTPLAAQLEDRRSPLRRRCNMFNLKLLRSSSARPPCFLFWVHVLPVRQSPSTHLLTGTPSLSSSVYRFVVSWSRGRVTPGPFFSNGPGPAHQS